MAGTSASGESSAKTGDVSSGTTQSAAFGDVNFAPFAPVTPTQAAPAPNNTVLYIVIGAAVLFIVGIIYYFSRGK